MRICHYSLLLYPVIINIALPSICYIVAARQSYDSYTNVINDCYSFSRAHYPKIFETSFFGINISLLKFVVFLAQKLFFITKRLGPTGDKGLLGDVGPTGLAGY